VTYEQAIALVKDVGVPAMVLIWVLFVFVPKHLDKLITAVEKMNDSGLKAQGDQRDATVRLTAAVESLARDVKAVADDVDEVRKDRTDPRIKREGG
jgi:hypothetical protein